MPQVPRLDSPGVRQQIGQGAQITTNVSAEALNAGKSLEGVFSAAEKLADHARKSSDEVAVLDAQRKLTQLETNLLYDPKTGAYNKKGKDAFNAVGEVDQAFTKGTEDIESGLTGNTQREMFRRHASQKQQDIFRQMDKHVSTEIVNYDNAQTESFIASERNAALVNPYDLNRVDESIKNQQQAITQHAERNGMPKEWIDQKAAEAKSQTHSGIVQQYLASGNDIAASSYYEKNREQFVGKDLTNATKDVEEGSLRGFSQRESDKIFSRNLSMSDAVAEAKKIDDPRKRDATVERVKQNYQDAEIARRNFVEKNNIAATNFIDQNPDINSYIAQNPRAWDALDSSEKTALKNYADTRRKGLEPATNWQEYYNLRSLASSTSTRDEFMRMDLYGEYRNKLSDEKFSEIVKLQADLRNGDEKTGKALDGYRSDEAIVEGVLASAGYGVGKDNKTAIQFKRMVDEKLVQLQESTGKKYTGQDVQKISDDLMVKVVTEKGMLWDSTKRSFELDPTDEIKDVAVKDVPRNERSKIEQALRKNGQPINDQSVAELFRRKLMRDRTSNANK